MNKLTLKRFRLPTDDESKTLETLADSSDKLGLYEHAKTCTTGEVRYEVIRVVGSVRPFVGEILNPDYVHDLCNVQTGTWTVTFI